MTCFAILFVGCLLMAIASISGVRGLPLPAWNTAKEGAFANTAFQLFSLLVAGWLACDSVRHLVKIIKDIFTWNRKYEGVLIIVEKKRYKGFRINYQMLALECADATWEISPG
ncbi:hypothetical protein [Niabella aurantiaca]|uniref:hypothetical protein n=1 Tax=Niabella aurantiaca TaxID=379900 RepID=UPI000378CDE8|nr:hypothetical protein [Niabella aurantiaca]